jgi:mono/diheme cytochrome c family protein
MTKIAGIAVLAGIATAIVSGAESDRPPSFESNILPIFQAKCLACHSGASAQAGLDLATRDSAMRGGKSGAAIKPGSSEGSLLVEKIVSKAMPPVQPKLTDKEIALIRSWIDKGMAGPGAAAELVTEHDILPIFLMRCVICHGKRKQEGGLDLRTQASRLKGGKSGPALVPGKPEESLLLKRITSGEMPPSKLLIAFCVRPPTSSEVELIHKWIAAGAPPAPKESIEAKSDNPVSDKDMTFWSFQPPKRPAAPSVRHKELVRNPVDAFLLAKLEAKDLTFSSPAEPQVLMRRAYLDLIGVPPSSAEIDAYSKDHRADAYERMVDRLLDSPHYGERWAQFWLNAAGYSDSEGSIDEDRIRSNAWRYRDYVIRSLNADKPYDQFLTEQIAGDELVSYKRAKEITPDAIEKLVATGFLRMASDGTYDLFWQRRCPGTDQRHCGGD